jgi:hypothetical protein
MRQQLVKIQFWSVKTYESTQKFIYLHKLKNKRIQTDPKSVRE